MQKTENYSGDIPRTPLEFIWYVSKPRKWWLFALMVVVTVAAILSQGSSYFFKLIVDAAEVGDAEKVFLFGLAYPVTIFVTQTLFRLSGWIGSKYITHTIKFSSDVLPVHTLEHSHTYFSNRFAGSVLTKFGNVVKGVNQILNEFVWTIYTGLLSFLVTFVLMLTVNLKIAFIFLGLVAVLILLNQKLSPRKKELSRLHADSRSILSGKTADVLSNVSAVRQYANLDPELYKLQSLTEKRRIAHTRSWMYSERTRLINSFVLFVAMLLIFWLLLTDWQAGLVSTGDLVLVLALISQISYALLFIGQAFNSIAEAFGDIEEGLEDLIVDHEITDAPNAQPLQTNQGAINFDAMTFAYDSQTVFDNLNLIIESGQRVGLVGPSGAGKSTLVSLLLRQHDINSGAILIDGQNIAQVTQDSLRQNIALVPQEPMLFHRSIRENIMYGKPDATHDEMVQAAERAQAREFIESLPEGYDTLVGERGVKLSGGQKQRVAIARAMLKEAPILVLDEATSALDSESEVAIQKALEELMVGKTVIAVAHRLSTLRKMDRILVVDNGKIVEDGTHDELAQAGGLYAKLWAHQAGGFLQE